MVSIIRPFQNESESAAISDLTVENRLDRVSIYGSIQITKDQRGLKHAEALKSLLDDVLLELRREPLPDKVSVVDPVDEGPNPLLAPRPPKDA